MTRKRKRKNLQASGTPVAPRVYGYSRVSTYRQTGGQSIETQHEQLRLLAQRHGLDNITRIFTDEEASGGTPIAERPAGRELCFNVSPGDVILLTDLDRAFRSTSDALDTLLKWHAVGIRVIIQSLEGWGTLDISSPIGEFFLTVLVAVKRLERNQRVSFVMQCSRDAAAKAAAEGWDGSSRRYTPVGYKWGFLDNDRGKTILVPIEFDFETMAVIGWLRDHSVAYDKIRDQILPEIGRHKRTRSSRRQVGNVRAGYRRYEVTTVIRLWHWHAMDNAQAWCHENPERQEELIRTVASANPAWALRWGMGDYVSRLDMEKSSDDGTGLTGESTLPAEEIGEDFPADDLPGEVDCRSNGDGGETLDQALARSETLQDGAQPLCRGGSVDETNEGGRRPQRRLFMRGHDGGEGIS